MIVTQINIDLAGEDRAEYVVSRQKDEGRVIQVTLYDNGNMYLLDNKTTARVYIVKPDKTEVIHDCKISNNRVEIELDANILAMSGIATAEIFLTGENQKPITSAKFDLIVKGTLPGDKAESSEDYQSFKAALGKIDGFEKEVASKATKQEVAELREEDKKKATKEELEVERSRINNLAKLEEGATTGDAELVDIRVGEDGETYDTAGAAVRGQNKKIKENISEIRDAMKADVADMSCFTLGKVNENTGVVETSKIEMVSDYALITERITMRVPDGYLARACMYSEFDGTKRYIGLSGSGAWYDTLDITPGENTNYYYRFSIKKNNGGEITTNELVGKVETTVKELQGIGEIKIIRKELKDIRTAADGTVYETAGEAVREQVKANKVEIDANLEEEGKAADAKAVGDVVGSLKEDLTHLLVPLTPTILTGKIVKESGLEEREDWNTYKYELPTGCKKVSIKTNLYGNAVVLFSDSDENEVFNRKYYLSYFAGYEKPTDVSGVIDTGGCKFMYIPLYVPSNTQVKAAYNDTINKEKMDNTLEKLELLKHIDIKDYIQGYINKNGLISTNAELGRIDGIEVQKGNTVAHKCYSVEAVAVIYKCNSDGTYTPLICGNEKAGEYEYVYTANEDMVIGVSFYVNKYRDTLVYTEVCNALKIYENKDSERKIRPQDTTFFKENDNVNLLDVKDGLYVLAPITISVEDNAFKMTKNADLTAGIGVEIAKIELDAGTYTLNVFCEKEYSSLYQAPFFVGMYDGNSLFKYAWLYSVNGRSVTFTLESKKEFIVKIVAQYYENANDLLNTEGYAYCKIMLEKGDVAHNYLNPSDNYYLPSAKRIEEALNSSALTYSSLSMFEKIGVIGDSYASGQIYLTGSPVNYYNLSWGQVLARKNGIECINFSKGGLTSKTWLTDSKGLSLMKNSEPQSLYLIVLGINDNTEIVAGRYSFGTDADFDLSDFENAPDTFYGNMCKIIGYIKQKSPSAKIIVSTMANNNSEPSRAMNIAIEKCAELAEVPTIKQYDDMFFTSDYYKNGMVGGHPTAPVYSGMALAFERLINQCISENYDYFKDFTWSSN